MNIFFITENNWKKKQSFAKEIYLDILFCLRILSDRKRLGAAILLVWDNTPSTKSLKIDQIHPSTNHRVSNSRNDDYDDDDMDYDQSYSVWLALLFHCHLFYRPTEQYFIMRSC